MNVKDLGSYNVEKDIADYTDADYREFWSSKSKTILHLTENKIIQPFIQQQQGWIMDLGAGFGRLVPLYSQKSQKVVLVDYALNLLQMADEKYQDKELYLVAADVRNLPFRNQSFDATVCVRVFHHIANPQTIINELGRIFKPGGKCLFNFMNKRNLLRILRYGRKCFHHSHDQDNKVLYVTHPSFVKKELSKQDFKIIKTKGCGFIHQIAHRSKNIESLLEKWKVLYYLAYGIELSLGRLLGKCSMAVMQFLTLHKKDTNESIPSIESFIDLLQCPKCGSYPLEEKEAAVVCPSCSQYYQKTGRIIDFRL